MVLGGLGHAGDVHAPEQELAFLRYNTPLGYGYDLNGRVYFFNVAVNFGGSQ